MTTPRYSKREMAVELAALVFQWARINAAIFSDKSAYAILGKQPPRQVDQRGKSPFVGFLDSTGQAPLDFDISSTDIAMQMDKLYDYGVLGWRTTSFDGLENGTDESAVCNFIQDVAESRTAADISHGESVPTQICQYVVGMAAARSVLDGYERVFSIRSGNEIVEIPHGLLTVTEVALLASLDERTVRNATGKTAQNRLRVTHLGPNVFVHRDAAAQWLCAKKGFRPTQLNAAVAKNLELRHFRRADEVGAYIGEVRKKRRMSTEKLINVVGSLLTREVLEQIESGSLDVDPSLVAKIALALEIPCPDRFADYAQLLQKISEIEELKLRLGVSWPASPLQVNEMLQNEAQ